MKKRKKSFEWKESRKISIKKVLEKKNKMVMVADDMQHTLAIANRDQLNGIVDAIEKDDRSNHKQKEKKLKLVLKVQLKLRKFVYGQNHQLYFSRKGKAIPVKDLLWEFF